MIVTHIQPIDQAEDDEHGREDNTGDGIKQSCLGESDSELLPESRSWFDILDFITDIFDEWFKNRSFIIKFFFLLLFILIAGVSDDEDPGVLKNGKEDKEDAGDGESIKIIETCCHISFALGTVEGVDSDEEEDNETPKPTRDNIRRNNEADPWDKNKEVKGDIDLID